MTLSTSRLTSRRPRAGGGGGPSTSEKRPWWQPAISSQKTYRMVPDVAAFADASPGSVIICSPGVQGRGPSSGQTISYVGGTSSAAPLVAGLIALWDQQAQQFGLSKPGFVAPLLYSIAHHTPVSFLDITTAGNSVFSGVSCCTAGAGFDLASGLGSPFANQVIKQVHRSPQRAEQPRWVLHPAPSERGVGARSPNSGDDRRPRLAEA
jgi:subtilase family serine protease